MTDRSLRSRLVGPRLEGSGPVWVRGAAAAFPVLLWLIATFFLAGDLGLWNDDWFYVQRVPETGEVRALVLDRSLHFWRPLYRVVVPALATLLWEHQQVNHLISAAAHAVVTMLLWLLLWRLGVRRLACGLAALLFLVLPWHAEVVFWLCNLPTSLSAAVMLGMMHVALTWRRGGWGTGGWWVAGMGAGLTFGACCFNEQPAMLFGAVPLVYLCGVEGRLGRREIVRAAALGAAGAVAVGVYTWIHARQSPAAMDIGGGHGVLPLAEWPESAWWFWRWTNRYVWSGRWLVRALECGVTAMEAHPARAAALSAGLGLSVAVWIVSMSRDGHRVERRRGGGTNPGANVGRMVLLGLAMIVLTAAPIVAFRYWLMPRVLYPLALGLAVLLGAAMTFATNRSPRPVESLGRMRAVVAGVGAVMLGVLALAMVGVQEGFQRHARMDREILAQVRALVPDPAPGSVLVPAHVSPPGQPERAMRFESYYWNVVSTWWSARWATRLEYRRSDLSAGHATWGKSAWRSPAPGGVHVDGAGRVPWDRVVPFAIDGANTVRLVTAVVFTDAEGNEREVAIPQAARMVERGVAPERVFKFPAETR